MPRLNHVDRRLAYVAGVRKGSEGREGRFLPYPSRDVSHRNSLSLLENPWLNFFPQLGGGGGVLRIFTDGDDRMWANIKTRKKSLDQKLTPLLFYNHALVLSYFGGSEHRYRI